MDLAFMRDTFLTLLEGLPLDAAVSPSRRSLLGGILAMLLALDAHVG